MWCRLVSKKHGTLSCKHNASLSPCLVPCQMKLERGTTVSGYPVSGQISRAEHMQSAASVHCCRICMLLVGGAGCSQQSRAIVQKLCVQSLWCPQVQVTGFIVALIPPKPKIALERASREVAMKSADNTYAALPGSGKARRWPWFPCVGSGTSFDDSTLIILTALWTVSMICCCEGLSKQAAARHLAHCGWTPASLGLSHLGDFKNTVLFFRENHRKAVPGGPNPIWRTDGLTCLSSSEGAIQSF